MFVKKGWETGALRAQTGGEGGMVILKCCGEGENSEAEAEAERSVYCYLDVVRFYRTKK